MARLREGHEGQRSAADAAAEERLAEAMAQKKAQLNDIQEQLQLERSQHRTAQASLDKWVDETSAHQTKLLMLHAGCVSNMQLLHCWRNRT